MKFRRGFGLFISFVGLMAQMKQEQNLGGDLSEIAQNQNEDKLELNVIGSLGQAQDGLALTSLAQTGTSATPSKAKASDKEETAFDFNFMSSLKDKKAKLEKLEKQSKTQKETDLTRDS